MKGGGGKESCKKRVFSRRVIDKGEVEVVKRSFYVVGCFRFFGQVGAES